MLSLASLVPTLAALAIGGAGAGIAFALSLPAALLIGPAIAVTAAALAGIRLEIADPLRNVCFVVLGMGIGSGFTTDAGAAIQRWPFAFLTLAIMLAATLALCGFVLRRWFGFDRTCAILAGAPGHLSFVLGLAHDTGSDVARVAVVQTIRLLALTVSVPFAAAALGVHIPPTMLPQTVAAGPVALLAMAAGGVIVGLAFQRLRFPAPLLLGPMVVSAGTHVTGLFEGSVPNWMILPAFLVLGTLIGTRFAGMTIQVFRSSLLAGLSTTVVSVSTACLAAIPVAVALGMPVAHVFAAFSPGGLETMVALGAAMGASPGFVAACHIVRLMVLSFLIPLFLGRRRLT